MASSSASVVGPTVSSVPSYSRTRSAWTLSTVLPASSECVPQELLPIMPPRLQRLCVDGSGPNVRPCASARPRSVSSTTPGCTRAMRLAGIQLENPVHVLGEVEDDGDVAALAGEARARAARKYRRAERPARRDRGPHIVFVPGDDDADGNLTVVRGIRRVERARAAIEPHLAADRPPQLGFERLCLGKGVDRVCVRAWR